MRLLGRDTREKHKFDVAFTYAKNKLTEFRTEERRKVQPQFETDYYNYAIYPQGHWNNSI